MSLPHSGMVYLFSDRFVEGVRFLGEGVPCTEVKVKRDTFAVMLVAAALTRLHSTDYLDLSQGERSTMLGLRKLDTVTLKRCIRPGLHSDSL